ncbi:MAG: glycosyltransferase family 2 protein [Candidatus Saccharibacteria bacterium]|nr:glycosyltransferase family 2 protein [Candidatus Saccharibacteria bacterium]
MATTKKKTGTVKVASMAASRTTQKKTETVKVAKKKPVVSVVMPAHNAADFIDDAIHSVLGQTFADFELLIVDDASTDKTLEVVGQFGDERIRVISCKRNGGAAKARNRGVRAARGRYIAFIDADDLWQPSKLEKQVAFMREKDSAFSFGSYVFADAKGRPKGKVVRVPSTITYKQALKNTTIWTSTVMLDLKKLNKSDVMMPDVESEDTATWWKILRKIDKAEGIYEVVAIYRRSGKTLSSNKIVAIRRIWDLYRKSEELNPVVSSVNFLGWAFNAVRRRV